MSYLGEPFKYDICASYSHGDPKGAGTSKFKSYSQGLLRELETELKAHPTFGDKLTVFFDDHDEPGEGLDPNSALTEQLRTAMGQSAIFTVLMSDHYLRSKWCADEREYWLKNGSTLAFDHSERLSVARIWNTTEKWPSMLVDERGNPLVGTCYFDQAHVATAPWPYAWPEPDAETKDPFRRILLSQIGLIWQQIEKLKTRLDAQRRAQQDVARLSDDSGQVLYLHARSENEEIWSKTSDALTEQGFTVLPSQPEPVETDPDKALRVRNRRVETLSGCDALLLVGSNDGPAVEADLVVVGRQDRDSARALGRRILPCALLDTVGAPVATGRRTEAARRLRVDWLDCTSPPWVGKVHEWLTQKSTEARRST